MYARERTYSPNSVRLVFFPSVKMGFSWMGFLLDGLLIGWVPCWMGLSLYGFIVAWVNRWIGYLLDGLPIGRVTCVTGHLCDGSLV